ncbi:GTP-binding protein (ISS) [Dorcoceras hygrometricum]|uniref:GTP-binding protein (ISS) n=1 Tax=Dorcoceras hygrometricum TaxID=472368 RepID=A0A2Z7B3P9_9LAMI|nr:GTP-binding protein (ISS) [Dorcoceras hygrometricum]
MLLQKLIRTQQSTLVLIASSVLALRLIHLFFTTETVSTAGLLVRISVHAGTPPGTPLCPAWLSEEPAMGNTDQSNPKKGKEYELGGRHSNPVVTTPTIALDFSDTTQQSASHNVAPNQKLPRQLPFKIPRSLNLPKIPNILAQTNERKLTQRIETHDATYCSIQPFRVPAPAQHSFQKLVGKDRSSQEVSNATKNSKNGGRNQRKIAIENDGEQ